MNRLHLIDAASDQASATTLALIACSLSRSGQDADRVMLMGGSPMRRDAQAAGLSGRPGVTCFSVPFGQAMLGWPAVQARLLGHSPAFDEVYAWSLGTLALAILRWAQTPIIFMATLPPNDSACRWLRALAGYAGSRLKVIATNSATQHHLIGRGLNPATVRTIRPGLDWSLLADHATQRQTVRQRLGLAEPHHRLAAIVSDPPTAADAKVLGMALSLASEASDGPNQQLKLLIHRHQAQGHRMIRLLRPLDRQNRLVMLPDDLTAPWLHYPAADLALAAGPFAGGLSLTWAAACGLPIVGEAIPAICDVVEDRQTAFLTQPHDPKRLSMRLVALLANPAQAWQCKETARQQAFKLYSASGFRQELACRPAAGVRLPVIDTV